MAKRLLLALALVALTLPAGRLAGGRTALAGPTDFDIDGGHFYTQTAGDKVGEAGFAVRDDNEAKFWSALKAYGGPETIGYPISHRFMWNGLVSQAFQKVIFQWNPASGGVAFVNVFDELHEAGKDDWLAQEKMTPYRIELDEKGFTFEQIRTGRLALLKENRAIEAKYNEHSDPLLFYGLPTSKPVDMGNAIVVRFQRAVMQQWKTDFPWAKAGEVVVANGADLAKEAGLLPREAIVPVSASTPLATPGSSGPVGGPATGPGGNVSPTATITPSVAITPTLAGPTPTAQGGNTVVIKTSGDTGTIPIPATDADATLTVTPVLTGSKKPGATATLEVTVTFRDGKPVRGAGVGVIASFPDQDDIFFMPNTDANGKTSYPVQIHNLPAGSQIQFKVQAFFPYYGGTTRFSATIE